MEKIYNYFNNAFHDTLSQRHAGERRIGAELKFPLVNEDGSAVSRDMVASLWSFLQENGWSPVVDAVTDRTVGATQPGEKNDTVASCETGYCKTEFSLAHVGSLEDLDRMIKTLTGLLCSFSKKHNVHFLGYGIHPVTRPGKHLVMKKARASVWDKVFASNRYIPEGEGDDFHLFTLNAANHVHVSVSPDEAIRAVNVLNGFAAPQIAVTANSNIWKGELDPTYKCVSEKLWDWWMPEDGRTGIPEKHFTDLQDYIEKIASFRPVFVKREGKPLVLDKYDAFHEYFNDPEPVGLDAEGQRVPVQPEFGDFDVHCTCYWYNARISRYFTVENRVNDQQPPADLITVSAITLGLISAMDEAWEEVQSIGWEKLRRAREEACRHSLDGSVNGMSLTDASRKMLDLAREGLVKRGKGEERYLEPLYGRIKRRSSPADDAERLFQKSGIEGLIEHRTLENALVQS